MNEVIIIITDTIRKLVHAFFGIIARLVSIFSSIVAPLLKVTRL